MSAVSDILDHPLTADELAARFRDLCSDPAMAGVRGKIELDGWGRILLTPASNYHGYLQAEVARRLSALPGRAMVETSVVTNAGVLVADAAWCSPEFLSVHQFETPYTRAPEICVEVVSPSNTTKEMREKVEAYFAAGAEEVWLLYTQSNRMEFFGRARQRDSSAFGVDLTDLFD